MSESLKEGVRDALRRIIDPLSGRDVIAAGLVQGLNVTADGHAGFMIALEAGDPPLRRALQPACEAAVKAVEGITRVTAVLTAERGESDAAAATAASRTPALWDLRALPHVQRMVAVGAGKGGVGKSTLAAGIALGAAALGLKVGLLDADLHGPSQPRLLGIAGKPEIVEGMLVPLRAPGGIDCLSIGLLRDDGGAAVLRGPVLGKLLQQMLRGTRWGTPDRPLDLLVIDLPPGTGDLPLTLAQTVPLAQNGGGALLVTTPQQLAVDDASKAADMFLKLSVPILGVVENMSWLDTATGRLHPFGEGGGARLAALAGAPLLAQLALDPTLAAAADHGELPVDPFLPLVGALLERWERATPL